MTLVEHILRQTSSIVTTTETTVPETTDLQDIMAEESLEISQEISMSMNVDELAITLHECELAEPDFTDLEALLTSQDFSSINMHGGSMKSKTMSSIIGLLDSYIQRTFAAFQSQLKSSTAINTTATADASIRYESIPTITDADRPVLDEILSSLRKDIMHLVTEFLDDRLIQDRESFLHLKRTLLKEIHTARDTTHHYLKRVRDTTMAKKKETVMLIRTQYREKLKKEKDAIAGYVKRVTENYDSLWALHAASQADIDRLETLNRGLESQIKFMTDDHAKQLTKLQEECQERIEIFQSQNLFNSTALVEEEEVETKPCEICDSLREKIGEMEAQLRMADAVYSMKTALPTEVIKIIKMKSNRKSEEDDDDNMSVASGMSTASRRGHKKKKRGKGKKGSKPKRKKGGFLSPISSSRGHSRGGSHSPHRRDGSGSVCGSIAGSIDSEASSLNSKIDKKLMSLAKKTHGKGRNARSSIDTEMTGMSDFGDDGSEDLDLSSLKGGKNVSSLMRNSFTGDDDLNDSEAVASIMQHFRLDPVRVAEFAKALESGHIAGGEQRGSQVLLEHSATQTTDSVDDLLKTYLQATKDASAMYLDASLSLKQTLARNAVVEDEKNEMIKRLAVVEKRLKESTDLHDMQLKERNLLLIELTDQLTVTRKQLNKEQKIREHISKHDASVRYTEKGIGAFQKDRRDVVGVGLSIIKMPGLDAGGMGERELSMIGGPHPTLSGANLPGSNVSGTVGETEDDGGFRRIRPMTAGVVRQHRPMSSSSSSSLQQIPSFQDRSLSPPHGHQALNNQSNQSSPPSDIHNSLNVLARRPSTSGGNSVSYSTNLRHELYRKNRAVLSESFDAVPSSSASSDNTLKLFDNHMFAKQTRIINDAGHKAIIFTNQERVDRNPEKDLDKVISAINSDPLHAMSAERMSELKDVRTHIVTMLAHKVAAKKKPTGRPATAKAAEEGRKNRAMQLRRVVRSSHHHDE